MSTSDGWEASVRALLAQGNILEARRLAHELWDVTRAEFTLHRLHHELKSERQQDQLRELIKAEMKKGGGSAGQEPSPATELWPPSDHPTVAWSDLSAMEQEQVLVFLKAGKGAVLEVPLIARRSRGRDAGNRHDKETAKGLDSKGLTKRVGKTGRQLIAVPRQTPRTS